MFCGLHLCNSFREVKHILLYRDIIALKPDYTNFGAPFTCQFFSNSFWGRGAATIVRRNRKWAKKSSFRIKRSPCSSSNLCPSMWLVTQRASVPRMRVLFQTIGIYWFPLKVSTYLSTSHHEKSTSQYAPYCEVQNLSSVCSHCSVILRAHLLCRPLET